MIFGSLLFTTTIRFVVILPPHFVRLTHSARYDLFGIGIGIGIGIVFDWTIQLQLDQKRLTRLARRWGPEKRVFVLFC